MYLMQTVSAVPRPRTSGYVETKPLYPHGDYQKHKNNHSLENGSINHGRIIYELGRNIENETDCKRKEQNEVSQTSARNNNGLEENVRVDNEEDKEKKKEKKWSLGGLFRRKNKKDADDSSDDSGEENKKGFLARRRSKREGRKTKIRSSANGFDVVIPQVKEAARNGEISVEQLWGEEAKPAETNNGPVRYIHRHPDSTKTTNSLQVPKNCRRDSNISRSSGGSENAEGRKGRKEVMARAEAKRDMMRDDSSSDEFDSYNSNSSLNRVNGEYRKPRRSDRHKRLSKEEDSQTELRMIKSDLEGSRRLPPNCRWISRTFYPDSSDHEAAKLNLLNHSGTSSPCRSPRARQKQLLHYMMMQNSYPTTTFPPGVHHHQTRNATPVLSPARNPHAKENQSFVPYRNQVPNRNSECNLPRSLSSSENTNRKTLMDYEQFLNSCGSAKEKSLSYDQNIHRASYFENESEMIRRMNQANSRRTNRSEMFINGGRGVDIYNHGPQQAVKTYNGSAENRIDSTPSLHSGIFPPQQKPIVQRSASGNSFCESSRNFHPNRSNSYQHIPNHGFHPAAGSLPDNVYCNLPVGLDTLSPKTHISESPSILRYYADQNPRSRNPIHITCNPTTPEHPYLSDSQVNTKPILGGRRSASDFWRLKDQEVMKLQGKCENSLKPPQNNPRSRSNSPRLKEEFKVSVKPQEKPVDGSRRILKEEYNADRVMKNPPEPPVRKLSKQEVLARLRKCEQLKNEENEIRRNLKNDTKVHNNNLDEALNELEMIYNSLRLKDEDLVDRAERRDLPTFRPKNPITPVSVRDKIQNFYAETNYSKNSEFAVSNGHQRAIPLRRSGVPDKMADDMAFRRLNQKDRADVAKLPPQSYLRSSPALSPLPNGSPIFRRESPVQEPDVTYDDVVFRNLRHVNSTLKIQDPQPPFGIPIGVVTPAPNSDYLHATPTERFRPTFTSSKTPDVVKDDLAFRNLRKDNKTNSAGLEPKNDIKKRAVRSLSANLYNIMQKDNPALIPMETNNNVIFEKSCEKTQSLTDLTKGKQALEKRLKELKEENNSKRAEFFEVSQDGRKKANPSWTDLANLNGNFGDAPEKLQKNGSNEDGSKKFRSPVVELSKYPAAAPSSSLQGNPFKEPTLVDDDQLKSLFSALAMEAENASKDLERQLDQLETKKSTGKTQEVEEKSKERAIEEFNRKFKSTDKTKRRRNLSLSTGNESKEDVRKTGSLERRRKSQKPPYPFEDVLREKSRPAPGTSKSERKISKSDSSSSLGGRSQTFEVVTDLSQILREVEAEQQLNNEISHKETSVFQEVYEYNCNLESQERRKSRGSEEPEEAVTELARPSSDVETEFEKLHEETKEADLALVEDLMADIASVEQSPGGSCASFPFPSEGMTVPGNGTPRRKDGTSPGSGKGEGEPEKPSHLLANRGDVRVKVGAKQDSLSNIQSKICSPRHLRVGAFDPVCVGKTQERGTDNSSRKRFGFASATLA